MAGLFFAFSTSVMPGLARVPGPEGARAMQESNKTILNPLFLLVFLGTGVLGVVVAILALVGGASGAVWLVIGGLLYPIGGVVVTMVVNVPMNNRLVAADADSAEGQAIWTDYLARWTPWNHLRAVTSALSTAALAIGLI
ncbi:hypothetical protein BJF78_08210 [Pseudonocardia sp. CNS-139]|nr:hypothetical protein BJF78_08210 [Pseudonocardia sp. CNS-139]